jgi:hypothetical protein
MVPLELANKFNSKIIASLDSFQILRTRVWLPSNEHWFFPFAASFIAWRKNKCREK